jgi:D-hydroxyproline dehydrogenase subunit gamma
MTNLSRRLDWGGAVRRGRALTFEFDGQHVSAFDGETVAAALLAAGERVFRLTAMNGSPRGLYCGMGVCFDCMLVVDGRSNTRACLTPAKAGMRVSTQVGLGADEGKSRLVPEDELRT